MYCQKCGKENLETSKFCKGCGGKIQPTVVNSKKANDVFEKIKSIPKKFAIAGLAIILALAIVLTITLSGGESFGNTPGNILNYGNIAQDNKYAYFNSEGLRKVKFSEMTKYSGDTITNIPCSSINIYKNYIYFLGNGVLYRTNKKGENTVAYSGIGFKRISNESDVDQNDNFLSALVYDGWIYLYNSKEVTRIKIDGSKRESLLDHVGLSMTFHKGWFYCAASEGIIKMRPDGSNKQTIDIKTICFVIYQNHIVYVDKKSDLICADLNGMTKNIIASGISDESNQGQYIYSVLNVSSKWIYYRKGRALYKNKLNGEKESLVEAKTPINSRLLIINDSPYCPATSKLYAFED